MSVEFGMPSLIEAPDLSACFDLAVRLGLSFVELNMNLPECQLDAIDVPLAKSLMRETGVYLTLHLDENCNPFDFNSKVADAHLQSALGALALARQLRCPIVNMHLPEGVYFTLPDGKVHLFAQYKDHFLGGIARFRDAAQRAIQRGGPRLCIENCGGFLPFQKEGIGLLLQSPSFYLTYDTGHDWPRLYDRPFYLAHQDRLGHMHLHDANAESNHLALGDGQIDIAEMLLWARRAKCRCVLETKSIAGLQRSMQYLSSIRE